MKKLIDLHWKWMEKGYLPRHNGLCNELSGTIYHKTLKEIMYGRDLEKDAYWGSKYRWPNEKCKGSYCTRRQSIVLLICAMHGEI